MFIFLIILPGKSMIVLILLNQILFFFSLCLLVLKANIIFLDINGVLLGFMSMLYACSLSLLMGQMITGDLRKTHGIVGLCIL